MKDDKYKPGVILKAIKKCGCGLEINQLHVVVRYDSDNDSILTNLKYGDVEKALWHKSEYFTLVPQINKGMFTI